MVLFFTSTAVDPAQQLYMGRDKVENEELLRYGDELDVWFHVDKLSSAHVYLRLTPSQTWDALPTTLLDDASQLVKANSIEGNKKDNITIIYTPWSNVKKTGDMATGSVSFHNERVVKRHYVAARDNKIVNRLNKTKREEQVDHEAQRVEREKARAKARREVAVAERNKKLEEQRTRQADKSARDYSSLYGDEALAAAQAEKARVARAKAQEAAERAAAGGGDDESDGEESDDSFM
ncbi:DUF814-domain-containing protein [Tilletiopsis washingtonensis]|uniref:DUF814-domain-containing protein n=1 Tax=Tilletiopsis washingtonensis TaxID=58919 RepID=A0A316ZB63_9BASI|nr:DUF814-domain-containing protein [Tilletiopsis washingtonensis]PWN99077.1 DUF814-domain-containing protein [Tilletiopsis washingtonensis]